MKRYPLIRLLIEVTQNCNLRCRYCFLENYRGVLKKARLIKLMDEAAELGTLFLKISGGEPFMRSDCLDIIEEARNRGFAVRLGTNGTLITDDIAGRLAQLNVYGVELTLYGASDDTYVSFTGVRAFSKVMAGIQNLSSRGVKTTVKFPITKINYHEVPKVRSMFNGMPYLKLIFAAIISGKRNYDMSPIEYQIPTSDIYQIAKNPNIKFVETFSIEPLKYYNYGMLCSAGVTGCTICPDGRVLPCPNFPLEAGNIYEKSLGEIWNYSEVFLRLRNLTLNDLIDCRSCKYLKFCTRCPAMAYIENRDYCRAPKTFCKFTQEFRKLEDEAVIKSMKT
ncbi:MAG: radical SAM protein [bacterium]|nr:radical SAM protein [bacterium]